MIAQSEPAKTEPNLTQKVVPQIPPPGVDKFTPSLLPVGLVVNDRTKLESFSVLGQENGTDAVNFDDWLLPFDELAQALGWKIKEIDSQLEISSPSQKFRLAAAKIVTNKSLGRAISVRNLATIPSLQVKFDINKYAIDLKVSSGYKDGFTAEAPPIVLDGLDRVKPTSDLGVSIIQERLNTSGAAADGIKEVQGEFRAAGSIFDAGWYIRFNQPSIGEPKNWNLTDGVILRQSTNNDLIIGSQNRFWRFRSTANTGDYWGTTTVYRQGFEPPVRFYGGDYVLSERLQARRTGRTISGAAEPGTLVQLVKNDRTILVGETLVDSSGIYRFDNVVVSGNLDDDLIGRDYKILLYPRGQLTANPIVRDITFTSFSGQIPVGAQAFVVSAGSNRISFGNFGSFDGFQGGVLYRRGLTEALTVGVGVAQDQNLKGIGEIFWQPSNPLEISASAAIDRTQSDYVGRLSYRPSNDFSATANTDQLSTSANASWRLGTNVAINGSYESLRGTSFGMEYSTNGTNTATSLRADIDNQGRIRTSASQRWEDWQANIQTNESASTAQINYRPTSKDSSESNSEFVLGYQNNRQTSNTTLTSLVWRYRSHQKVGDGRSLFQTELGYGINTFGSSGVIANADLNFIPGIQLRASYRSIADNSSQGNYAIEFTTTLLTNSGIRGTFDKVDDFRTVGKVIIQPFLDKNQNGRQEPGEESYWDAQLARINDRPLDRYRPQVTNDRGDLNLPGGSYRIDIDPAGYPVNYRSRVEAMRLEVVPGGITTVAIPLIPSYVSIGTVRNTQGDAVPGARVEATNLKTKTKVFSITNDAGFYTLEGLERGEYNLTVSDLPATPNKLIVTPQSQPTQELNITVDLPTENPAPAPTPPAATPPNNQVKIDRYPHSVYSQNLNHTVNIGQRINY